MQLSLVPNGKLEKRQSGRIDPSALEVGDERNLVWAGPRGRRGFPLCSTTGCRRESCGPFAHSCHVHWTEADEL